MQNSIHAGWSRDNQNVACATTQIGGISTRDGIGIRICVRTVESDNARDVYGTKTGVGSRVGFASEKFSLNSKTTVSVPQLVMVKRKIADEWYSRWYLDEVRYAAEKAMITSSVKVQKHVLVKEQVYTQWLVLVVLWILIMHQYWLVVLIKVQDRIKFAPTKFALIGYFHHQLYQIII